MNSLIRIVLALLFFLCLTKMSYDFYQFVKMFALIGFAILAYQANQIKNHTETIIFCALAILFQPFFKISLGRQMWNIIDVIVGIGLIWSVYKKQK